MTPRLFKAELNQRAEEFKKYLPVNVNCSFRSLAPALDMCERQYLLPVLGKTLFEELAAWYAAQQRQENPVMEQLLDMCQYAAVRLAYWRDFDILSVSLSDSGAADKAGEARLYRYQADAVKSSLKAEGFDRLDSVLDFCEEHTDELPSFLQSPARELQGRFLVGTTAQFNAIHDISSSRLVYLKMCRYMALTQDIELSHRLGAEFVSELLSCDESQQKYASILPAIRCFTVYWSLSEGIMELHQLPTEKGLVFEGRTAGAGSDVQVAVVPTEELERTAMEYRRRAERYLSSAVSLMQAHGEDYPAYMRHAGAGAPRNEVFTRDNTHKKIFFA